MDEIVPLPAFSDNYIWLLRSGRSAVLVDPGDAEVAAEGLEARGLELAAVLLTHHHPDHVGGVAGLLQRLGAELPVYGPGAENIAEVTHPLSGGDKVRIPGWSDEFEVIDVGGHTLGHIAYYGAGCLFSGDTLFAGGCGRVFEGTPEQMWQSLSRLAALPADTRVYCAHEYTIGNLHFAVAVEPGNSALQARFASAQRLREDGIPTVPSTIGDELATNPFLRVREPEVVAAAERFGRRPLASDEEVFAVLREWKNEF